LIASLLLGAALAVAAPQQDPEAAWVDRFPSAAASYLVSIDGRIVWARAIDTPRAPASLTKIMSALVLLEGTWRDDEEVVVSRRAAKATGSRAGLREGDGARAGDLLTAMLVASANDACLALAEWAAGSSEAFVDRMNRRAGELGLSATHFEDPCGHDAPGQRSSARDLLALAGKALAIPEFARIAALPSMTFKTRQGRTLSGESTNKLVGRLDGVAGVKSGYTPEAGQCVVVFAQRGATRVFVVLLDAPNRWWTAAGLTQAAFDEARSGSSDS